MNTPDRPAAWYPDPNASGQLRWWDGSAWTTHTHPAATSSDPAAGSWPAGWYPDSTQPGMLRWWDGKAWTTQTTAATGTTAPGGASAASRVVPIAKHAAAEPRKEKRGSWFSRLKHAATAEPKPTKPVPAQKRSAAPKPAAVPSKLTNKQPRAARPAATPAQFREKQDAATVKSSAGVWVPAGQYTSVQNHTLPGGMLYVGKRLAAANRQGPDPALINPTLPIDVRNPDTYANTTDYWPSYSTITPRARAAYLAWLAGGRRDPRAPVTWPFLFFYGLERRALVESPVDPAARADLPVIRAEVERLLSIYGGNGSFYGYANGFLDALDALVGGRTEPVLPPRTRDRWDVPFALRHGLGTFAQRGQPVPADWALAWANYSPEIGLRTPATRCPEEFEALFRIRYRAAHKDGLVLKPGKSTMRVHYQPASAGISAVRLDLGVPEVFEQAAPIRKLALVVDDTTSSLDAYSRFVGRRPDERGSLAAVALLPPELVAGDDPRLARLTELVSGRLGGAARAVVPADDLLAFWPTATGKLAKADAVALAQILAARGFGLEPDVRMNGPVPAAGTSVVVFKAHQAQGATLTPEYAASAVLIQLAATVAGADGHVSDHETGVLHDQVDRAPGLDDAERTRLHAHLDWLLAGTLKLTGLSKRLSTLSLPQREAIADFAASVATADGVVTPAEIRTLSDISKLLGLEVGSVYSRVHAATTGPATAPVTVRPATPGTSGRTIPPRPAEQPAAAPATTGVVLDPAVIAAKLAETAEVSSLLSSIFTEDEQTSPAPPAAVVGESVAGLDAAHSELLRRLATRETWTRADIEAACDELGLLTDGALDTLNETAYDIAGDPLVDGDDPVAVDTHVAQEMLA